jgi:outer membrane protein
MRRILSVFVLALAARAENHVLTLKQAVDRALAQNPEALMARLDQLKAAAAIRVTKDPFVPRLAVGSGLAYNNGFPLSIEGSAPAAFEARANAYIFNRPQTYAIAQAKENARGAGFAAGEKTDEIAFRVASLYIDADRAGRLATMAQQQAESLQRVLETVHARVLDGRELPISEQEANVNLLRARQRLSTLEGDRDLTQHDLASTLGFSAIDTVQPAEQERAPTEIPSSEQDAMKAALDSNKELKRLESNYQAKVLEIKGDKAQRLPRADLVAQYALLTHYSHYDEYFRAFKRNNGELGASFSVPLFTGPGLKATINQAEADQQHVRAEIDAARNKIMLDLHQAYRNIENSEGARKLAQAELDLARSQVSVLLAQMNEGRASLRQLEEARFNEDEKWIALYDAQFNAERARLNVLRQTGQLATLVR